MGRRELLAAGRSTVALSTAEFRLLHAFVQRPRLVLTREQLIDLTRGRDAEPFDRSIDNQISRLRKKLERDPSNPQIIKTVWGDGYQFAQRRRGGAMKWLLPRTMAGRLGILLVAALIVGQIVAFGIFAAERSDLSRAVARTQLANKVVTLIRVLDGVPATARSDVLKGFSSRRQHFSIGDAPSVAAQANDGGAREISERVGRLLGSSAQQVRISLKPDGGRPVPSPGSGLSQSSDAQTLDVSVQLANGAWLNGETLLRLPAAPGGQYLAVAADPEPAVDTRGGADRRALDHPADGGAGGGRRADRTRRLCRALAIDGPVEVSRTVEAFNLMQERLSRFLADRLAMLAAISHDLRTPITVARLRAEMVDDEDVREALVKSLDEMKLITESTLSFAKDEWGAEESRPVDLPSLVDAVADDLRAAGHAVDVVASPELSSIAASRPC